MKGNQSCLVGQKDRISFCQIVTPVIEQYYNATRTRLAGRQDLRERIMDLSLSFTDNCAQMDMLKLESQGLDGNKNLQKEWDTNFLRIMITELTVQFSRMII